MARITPVLLTLTSLTLACGAARAQQSDTSKLQVDTTLSASGAGSGKISRAGGSVEDTAELRRERDLIDIGLIIIGKSPGIRLNNPEKKTGKVHVSAAPAPIYSLETGWGVNLTGNLAFFTTEGKETDLSSILASFTYTQNQQIIIPVQSSIWFNNNKYNFVSDWRFLKFPEQTYGLGGFTTPEEGYDLDYNYIRAYQFILRKVARDFYIGPGIMYDYHYDIVQMPNNNKPTDYDNYGFSPNSHSSGIGLNFLYDTRKNSINPEGGSTYANLVLRQNFTFMGSDQTWNSVLLDARKYISLPGHSKNILAFWTYDWLILSGNPPYLDLPSTAWDTYDNTERGYIQSRFRSKGMLDVEGEYRFGILNNGLIGGVVFANAASFSQMTMTSIGPFQKIAPGYGAGLRFKFNKFSKTNICVDYAFGEDGSNGLFLNLGEVF